MSKKKRKSAAAPSPGDAPVQEQGLTRVHVPKAVVSVVAPGAPLAAEAKAGDWTATLMALMIFLAPTLGVPNEEMLQDTLKSIIVSGISLIALLVFWWRERKRQTPLRWHALMWLPLGLMVYALGSMTWSHAFLGGVEAIRWFIFSVIVFLGLNTFSRERFGTLAWGIHAGAVGACLWAALQFWFDMRFFPQGPNPASTFVNRNFVAEFVVCTLPFSACLIMRTRGTAKLALLSAMTAFNIVAILMTGTRSALVAMLVLGGVIALVTRLYRHPLGLALWSRAEKLTVASVMLGTVLGLGMVPSGNPTLENELKTNGQHVVPLARSLMRVQSIADLEEYKDGARAFSIRWVMWSATGRLIAANPVVGVGAGAWEVQIPKYQSQGSQLETDYYVHNEILQLLAEYGLVGWLFLLSLFSYLAHAAWRTWRSQTELELAEAPYRALVLAGLLAFLIVSNLGFPWRMASTGAMFALCLGLLAASDARLGRVKLGGALAGVGLVRTLAWKPAFSRLAMGMAAGCLVLCVYISHQAMQAERHIVRGVKLALTIAQSKQPNSPRWDGSKAEMLQNMRAGITITPHYRKLTPMVADELAKWGDWANAVWIWESVARSRPYVVAIMTNIARGYATLGNVDKADEYLKRCEVLQPNAPSVRSLQVIIFGRRGQQAEALALTQKSLAEGIVDYDLSNAAYILGRSHGDWGLALHGLQLRTERWPATAVDGWLKAGDIYSDPKNPKFDKVLAQDAYRQAYVRAMPSDKAAVLAEIPTTYRGGINVTH
jgi:O-antigen ligase